jgi:hypothetical protein
LVPYSGVGAIILALVPCPGVGAISYPVVGAISWRWCHFCRMKRASLSPKNRYDLSFVKGATIAKKTWLSIWKRVWGGRVFQKFSKLVARRGVMGGGKPPPWG